MRKMIFILLLTVLLTACGQNTPQEPEAVYVNISAAEAKQITDTEENYIILDVRTQEEYDQGHIPGAILIPDTEVATKAEEVLQAAGYEPYDQLYGYTMYGNAQYITRSGGAREIVTKMDIKDIKIFLKHYKEHKR